MANKRARRTDEERIAALQQEIEKLKQRAAERKVKRDPALRYISGAVRNIDKATAATRDRATREALAEARATLAACLELNGAVPATGGGRSLRPAPRLAKPDPERVLDFIRKNPGTRAGEICDELGTDTMSLRPVLHELRDEGKLKVEGKARGTRYSVST